MTHLDTNQMGNRMEVNAQCADPPPSKRSERQLYKSFERVKYPLLPTGIGERYSQTISNFCQAALLRRFELPL
jgi:hypothetical protein